VHAGLPLCVLPGGKCAMAEPEGEITYTHSNKCGVGWE